VLISASRAWAIGTSVAPTRPSDATVSEFQASATAVPAAAIPAAIARAARSGTRPYIAAAASRVAYPPAIPAPTAETAE
jgi:hypothetical protein